MSKQASERACVLTPAWKLINQYFISNGWKAGAVRQRIHTCTMVREGCRILENWELARRVVSFSYVSPFLLPFLLSPVSIYLWMSLGPGLGPLICLHFYSLVFLWFFFLLVHDKRKGKRAGALVGNTRPPCGSFLLLCFFPFFVLCPPASPRPLCQHHTHTPPASQPSLVGAMG